MSLHPLERIPAVKRLETTRHDLLAVEVGGHVSEADIENLCGLLEGAYAIHPRIDVLMRFVEHDGVDWRDVPSDTVEGGRAQAARHIRRLAAIGDSSPTKRFMRIFAPAEEGEARHFDADEEAEAWSWLDASQTEEDV